MYCSAQCQSLFVFHKNGSFNWFFNETKQATPGKKLVFCFDNCTLTYIFYSHGLPLYNTTQIYILNGFLDFKSCWYSGICLVIVFNCLRLCSLYRTALLFPAQAELWPTAFQGEKNSQLSLKFLKDVLTVHQPRVFAFEEHAFLISKVRFHIFFVTYKTEKSPLYTFSISPALQPQVPFPAIEAKITFDVFGSRCWPPVQLKDPCFIYPWFLHLL